MVVHTCNLSFLGGEDRRVNNSRVFWAKKPDAISTNEPGMETHASGPSYAGNGSKITVQGQP
jgi:hypothetical protein